MFSFGDVMADVREFVRQQIMPLIRYRRMTRPSADGWDEVTGHPAGPGEPHTSDQVRRMQHYGFRSQPPDGAELLTVAVGGAAGQHVAIASEVAGAGPGDQAAGDVALYAVDGATVTITANGATFKIDKDGNVTVNPAPGKQVLLGTDSAGAADYVVLFTALKSYLESHTHQPGSFTTAVGGGVVSGTSGNANEAFRAHAVNVLAKK